MPIVSFRCRKTEALYNGDRVTRWTKIERPALRKLTQLALAKKLEDLLAPPGNRLEALSGDRYGQYSIRINQQWRICFIWSTEGACEVEILDYH